MKTTKKKKKPTMQLIAIGEPPPRPEFGKDWTFVLQLLEERFGGGKPGTQLCRAWSESSKESFWTIEIGPLNEKRVSAYGDTPDEAIRAVAKALGVYQDYYPSRG